MTRVRKAFGLPALARIEYRPPVMRRSLSGSIAVLVILALTALTFANTLSNGFHLDDMYRVKDNPGIQHLALWRHFVEPGTMATIERIVQYRPLLPLTLSLNYAASGDSLVGYHLVNVALQGLAAALCFFLVLALLGQGAPSLEERARRGLALGVALAFAVHPISGIPVNYICARDLLLMEVFLLGSLLCYLRILRLGSSWLRWTLALLGLALSLLGKTDAVVAPALVFVLELTLGGQSPLRARPWLRSLPFAAVVLAYFAFERWVLSFSDLHNVIGPTPPFIYALTQARLHLLRYLPSFALPFSLNQDPLVPLAASVLEPGVLLGLLAIIGSLVAAFLVMRRAPLLSLCILAYWLLLAPTSSVLPLHHLAVDYRPYPGSPFLFLALGLAFLRLCRSSRLAAALAGAAVIYLAVCSMLLNRTWRTEETLWRHAVSHGGGALAHVNLAASSPDPHEQRRLLERALELQPGYVLAELNLGRTLVLLGEKRAGLVHCLYAARLSPRDPQVRHWMSVTWTDLGQHREAAHESALAVRLDPKNPLYLRKAVLDAERLNEHTRTLALLDLLRPVSPGGRLTGVPLFSEGFALQQLGRLEEAIAAYRTYLADDPRNLQVRYNLVHALTRLGRCPDASLEASRLLALQPSYPDLEKLRAECRTARELPR